MSMTTIEMLPNHKRSEPKLCREPQAAFTIDEVRHVLGIGRNGVYQAIRDGHLRAVKWGKRTLILRADLDNFLKSLPAMVA